MSERARQLIAQLRSFRSRKAAIDSLLMLGDEAIPDLIDTLAHPLENVRWAARSVLTQLGGDTVVQRLIETLDDPARKDEAAEALREITGQPLGAVRQAWAEWARTGVAPKPQVGEPGPLPPPTAQPSAEAAPQPSAQPQPTPPAEPLSDEAIVQAIVADANIDVRQHSGGYVLTVPLEGGRRQRVTISFNAKDLEEESLVVVYTECAPADPKNFEWALRQNLRMSFGAIAIRDRSGQPTFVMVNTHPRSTLDPEELRKSVLLLASKGDKLEAALTQTDER